MATMIGAANCAQEINACRSGSGGREVVPLVGAGFSCNAKPSFPLWKEIEDWVIQKLKISAHDVLGTEADDFTLSAEWYYYLADKQARHKNGRTGPYSTLHAKQEFLDCVRAALGVAYSDLEAHQALVEKFSTIYTTNWDCLLEEAINSIERGYTRRILRLDSNGRWDDSHHPWNGQSAQITHTLVKYHGCCDDKSGASIVASRSDFDHRVFLANTAIATKDSQSPDFDLHNAIPILIGYSYNDVNVRYVLSQVHSTYGRHIVGPIYNVILDHPSLVSPQKAEMYDEVFKIKTLFLLDGDDEYYKLKGRYDNAYKKKPDPSDITIIEYKKAMTRRSREAFKEFFDNLI